MLRKMPQMNKPSAHVALIAAVVVALLVPTAALSATTRVRLVGTSFRQASVEINRGDTVRWRNDSYDSHTITSYGTNWSRSMNVTLGFGATTARRFRSLGTFKYRCVQHSTKLRGQPCQGMCGVVKVVRTG